MTYTLANKQAVYFFNVEGDQVCVSKIVRKGQKGTDKYARCSITMARHWYKELLDEGAQRASHLAPKLPVIVKSLQLN